MEGRGFAFGGRESALEGGSAFSRGQTTPSPVEIRSTGGRSSSYRNTFLFLIGFTASVKVAGFELKDSAEQHPQITSPRSSYHLSRFEIFCSDCKGFYLILKCKRIHCAFSNTTFNMNLMLVSLLSLVGLILHIFIEDKVT